MRIILNFAITFISFFGIMLFIKKKSDVNDSFLPLITAGSIVSVLFLFGILNLLPFAVNCLHLTGIILFIYYLVMIVKDKDKIWTCLISPSTIFFVVSSMICIIILRNSFSLNLDAHTHWMLAIKEMISVQGLADARTLVTYKDYPPGAALFVFYFLQHCGFSESIALIAQSFLAMGAMSICFFNAKWKKPLSIILPISYIAIINSIYVITIHDFLVDYLVGWLSLGFVLFVSFNFEKIVELDTKIILLGILPLSVLLCLTKTSGMLIYFVALIIIIIGILKKQHLKRTTNFAKISLLLMPIVNFFLWKAYVDKAFLGQGYNDTKFALTISNFKFNLQAKSNETIKLIVSEWLKAFFTQPINIFVLVAFCVLAITFICLKLIKAKPSFKFKLSCIITLTGYVLYSIGYLFMLIFLMPQYEIETLNILVGYDRYMGTIIIPLLGTAFIFSYYELEKNITNITSKKEKFIIYIVCCLMGLTPLIFYRGMSIDGYIKSRQSFYNDLSYIHTFTAKVPRIYSREDTLVIYTGENIEKESLYSNAVFGADLLNKNVIIFNKYQVNGSTDLSIRNEVLDYYFEQADYMLIAVDDAQLYDSLKNANITIDEKQGIMYRVVTEDEKICLEKIY